MDGVLPTDDEDPHEEKRLHLERLRGLETHFCSNGKQKPWMNYTLGLGQATQTKYSYFVMRVFLSSYSLVILILLIWIVQMSGLNIYSYVEDVDVQFYRTQKSLAKRMDILD